MNYLKNILHRLSVKAKIHTFINMMLKNLLPAAHLKHRHLMLLLEITDLFRNIHSLRDEIQQLVIDFVDFLTEILQNHLICIDFFLSEYQSVKCIFQAIGRNLLFCIRQCMIRVVMCLYHESQGAHVEGFLCHFLQQFTAAANMADISNYWHVGTQTQQLNRNLPKWRVSIRRLFN